MSVKWAAVVLVLGLTACTTPEATTPPASLPAGFDLQGHRGARGLQPENTLPAFETALDLGVTTLELDLHFSADDEVVVWHDPSVTPEKCRLGEGAPPTIPDPNDPRARDELMIAHLTADQLRWFQCDRNPDEAAFPRQTSGGTLLAGTDYRIVTLDELMAFVERYAASLEKTDEQRAGAAAVRFNLETKRRPDDPGTIGDGFNGIDAGPFELAILDLADRFGLEDRIIVQSFDMRSLVALHAADPDIVLASLTSGGSPDLTKLAAEGVAIWSPRSSDLRRADVDAAHQAGLRVIPWTVNDRDELSELISIGVDGVITDRPDLVLTFGDPPA